MAVLIVEGTVHLHFNRSVGSTNLSADTSFQAEEDFDAANVVISILLLELPTSYSKLTVTNLGGKWDYLHTSPFPDSGTAKVVGF